MQGAFYAIYYTAVAGSGLGVLVFTNGVVVGADAGGGTYDGEYSESKDTGMLEGTLKLTMPAGVPLVTGGPASQEPYTIEFPVSLSQDLGAGEPVEVKLPTGPVNVIFKKLRDFPS